MVLRKGTTNTCNPKPNFATSLILSYSVPVDSMVKGAIRAGYIGTLVPICKAHGST